MGYVTAIIGALGSIGGGLASGAASKPKAPDIYGGFNPIQGVIQNLFGMPVGLGAGGLRMPKESKAIQNAINNVYAQGGSLSDVTNLINNGIRVPFKNKGGLLGGKSSFGLDVGITDIGAFGDRSVNDKIPLIGGLFKKKKSGITQLPPRFGFGFANPIFAPSDFNSLADLKEPVPLTEPQVMARELLTNGRLGELTGQTGFGSNINEVLDYLNGPLMGYGEELARTGYKTDIKPVQDYADFRFKNFILPELASQFGATTNALSSDFAGQAQLAGADLLSQLGALDTQLSESAAGRRVGGLDFLQQLNKQRGALPIDFAKALSALGTTFQSENANLRPGAALFQLLSALNGLGGGQVVTGSPGAPNPFLSSLAGGLGNNTADLIKGLTTGGQLTGGGSLQQLGGAVTGGQIGDLQKRLDSLTGLGAGAGPSTPPGYQGGIFGNLTSLGGF